MKKHHHESVITGGCRGMPHSTSKRQVTTGFATGLHDSHDSERPWKTGEKATGYRAWIDL